MIKPLNQIEDHEIEEQIHMREEAKTKAYSDYLYGASNTYNEGWRKYNQMKSEIEQLQKRREDDKSKS